MNKGSIKKERHDLIWTESIYAAQDKDPRPPQRVGTNTNAYTTRLYNPTQSSGQLEAPEGGLWILDSPSLAKLMNGKANQAR